MSRRAVNVCGECEKGVLYNGVTLTTLELVFIRASCLGHIPCIRGCLGAGVDVNTQHPQGCSTALMKASQYGHYRSVDLLIKAGADVNKLHSKGYIALTIASCEGHDKCVDLLLKEGADVNIEYPVGFTSLMKASKYGHQKCAELLIKAGADVNKESPDNNTSKIFARVKHGDAGDLLRLGIDVNKIQPGLKTALMLAAEHGHDKCVYLLVKAGAIMNKRDSNESTALTLASEHGHDKCVDLLLKAGANMNSLGYTALMKAAEKGRGKCVELVIKAGADVNKRSPTGDTSLMLASSKGHDKCVDLLLKAGADINCLHNEGYTALVIASRGGHDHCVDMLLEWGAKVEIGKPWAVCEAKRLKFKATERVFLDVVSRGSLSCLKALVKDGAGFKDIDSWAMESALMAAVRHGQNNCVDFLIEAGEDVNGGDKVGNTPLSLAVEGGNVEIRERLIKAGADVNHDSWGRPPLFGAVRFGEHKAVKSLIEAGADVNITYSRGNNTILHAVFDGCECCDQCDIGDEVRWPGLTQSVRSVLKAGARVNMKNEWGKTPPSLYYPPNVGPDKSSLVRQCWKEIANLLFVAGKTLGKRRWRKSLEPPTHKEGMLLKHICRNTIRKHLLKVDPHTNLFIRVPRLGLPSSLTRYLLYNISLDDGIEHNSDEEITAMISALEPINLNK